MILSEVKIHHLRNILSAHVQLNPHFNFIIGPNGSGKTTFLEALYLLSCGHSFRSREFTAIITHEQAATTVFARSYTEDSISILKSHTEATQLKLNNYSCHATSELAYALPCQIFYADIFQIIDAGSSVRRSLLDWGLFHVKHEYLPLLKTYKKVLKQRNALLKTQAAFAQFIPWDQQLSQLAQELHLLREDYFNLWAQTFYKVLAELTDTSCTIRYYKGWDRKNGGKALELLLADGFISDKQRMYTQFGAHQADILIESEHNKAKQVLSRGQQKIILLALKLAQAELLDRECLFLFDDLAAELDASHQSRLLSYLEKSKGQYVITSTATAPLHLSLDASAVSTYWIDAGVLREQL
ncbi:MAG: DNA replication/repair protein RecF [Legionellales bacterium]